MRFAKPITLSLLVFVAAVALFFGLRTSTSEAQTTSPLTITTPLALSTLTVTPGTTLRATITYTNRRTTSVTIKNFYLTTRPPGGTNSGGPYVDLSPSIGSRTLTPGQSITVSASRTWTTSDPVGSWYAFATIKDSRNNWFDSPSVSFTVQRTTTVVDAGTTPSVDAGVDVVDSGTSSTLDAAADVVDSSLADVVAVVDSSTVSPLCTSGWADNFDSLNTTRWTASDGFYLGYDFAAAWRADHVLFSNGIMTLVTNDQPCVNGTNLCQGARYASGELQSRTRYGYGRVEARMKPSNVSGMISSLFMYQYAISPNPQSEIDIEFVGNNTRTVWLTYWVNERNQTRILDLPFDASQDFHTYGFDYLPGLIVWRIDGAEVFRTTGSSTYPLPTITMQIMVNFWPTNDGWGGNFSYSPTVPVRDSYDWLRFTPSSCLP